MVKMVWKRKEKEAMTLMWELRLPFMWVETWVWLIGYPSCQEIIRHYGMWWKDMTLHVRECVKRCEARTIKKGSRPWADKIRSRDMKGQPIRVQLCLACSFLKNRYRAMRVVFFPSLRKGNMLQPAREAHRECLSLFTQLLVRAFIPSWNYVVQGSSWPSCNEQHQTA